MKTLILASFVLGAWTTSEYILTPKPEPERKIVRSFRFETEMVNEPSEEDEMGGDIRQEMSRSFAVVVADTLGEVKEGEAQSLTRTFQELESSMRHFWSALDMEPEEMEMTMGSELQGSSVLFVQGEEPTWAEGDSGDDELLEDLLQGMSLYELLPEGTVEIGDSWDLDSSFLDALDAPGGDLKFVSDDASNEDMMGPEDEGPEEEFAGKVGATLMSVDEEDGRRLATISLEIDVESTVDLTEMYQEMSSGEGGPDEGFIVPEIGSAESTVSRAGKGEAIWDMKAGHLVSIILELDVEQIETIELSFDIGEGPEEFEETNVMVGTESYEVSFDV